MATPKKTSGSAETATQPSDASDMTDAGNPTVATPDHKRIDFNDPHLSGAATAEKNLAAEG